MFDVLLDPRRDLSGTRGLAAQASRFARKAAFHLRSARSLGPADAIGYLGGRLATLVGRTRRRAAARAEANTQSDTPAAVDFLAIQHHAAERYSPRPYDGRVLLFRRELRPAGEDSDGKLGWGNLVRDLTTHTVPGDHRDMFLEPNVGITADSLRRHLNEEHATMNASRATGT